MQTKTIHKIFLLIVIAPAFYFANAQKIEGLTNDDKLRAEAINYFFGCPVFDEVKCKTILYGLGKHGDIKAMGWLSLFSFVGACGFGKNDDDGVFWAYRQNAYNRLSDLASNGDVESIFLISELFKKIKLANYGNLTQDELHYLFNYNKILIEKDYLPSLYFQAATLVSLNLIPQAIKLLEKSYSAGLSKAGFSLARIYENSNNNHLKISTDSLKSFADTIYSNLAARGDMPSIFHIAEEKLNTKSDSTARSEALKSVESAISKGSIAARIFLAKYYLANGNHTINNLEAVDLLKKAIIAGDVLGEAKLCLGGLYLQSPDVVNHKPGFDLLLKAAQEDNEDAGYLISKMYKVGSQIVQENQLMYSYWSRNSANSGLRHAEYINALAKTNGASVKDQLLAESIANLSEDFWNYKPTVTKRFEMDEKGFLREKDDVSDFTTDMLINVMGTVAIKALSNMLSIPTLPLVDGIELIKTKLRPDSSAIATTYSVYLSKTVTIDTVKKGDIISLKSPSQVSLKDYLSFSVDANGYRDLTYATSSACCPAWASVIRFNDGPFEFAGRYLANYNIFEDGRIGLSVNEKTNSKYPSQMRSPFEFSVTLDRPSKKDLLEDEASFSFAEKNPPSLGQIRKDIIGKELKNENGKKLSRNVLLWKTEPAEIVDVKLIQGQFDKKTLTSKILLDLPLQIYDTKRPVICQAEAIYSWNPVFRSWNLRNVFSKKWQEQKLPGER